MTDEGLWTMDRDRARAVHGLWSSIYHRAPAYISRAVFGFYPCHPVNPRSVFPRSIVHGPRSGIELVRSMVYGPRSMVQYLSPRPCVYFAGCFSVFIRVIRLIRVIRVLFFHGLSSMVHGLVLSSCGLSSTVRHRARAIHPPPIRSKESYEIYINR
jgi:hypothetical protein